jgi:uncharacterized protein YjbI with pentapeptide repeats
MMIFLSILLLGFASDVQALYFDNELKKCVSETNIHTTIVKNGGGLVPCLEGQISHVDFSEAQKLKGMDVLNLNGSKIDSSKIINQTINNLFLNYSTIKQSFIGKTKINFFRAEGSDFRGSKIHRAKFTNFSFKNANLSGVTISKTHFTGGDFLGTNFKGAMITDSFFEDCRLPKNFKIEAILINVELKNCSEL